MIRVSTTTIESFRRVVATEWGDEAELIASIRGERLLPSWQMEAGSAWQGLLERPRVGTCAKKKERGNFYACESVAKSVAAESGDDKVEAFLCDVCQCWHIGKPQRIAADRFFFDDTAISRGKSLLGSGLCEVKATQVFQVGALAVNVVAKVDHVRGRVIQENKAKFSSVDARQYEQVLQWRFYLLLHEAAVVRYNLFSFRDPTDDGYCRLTDVNSFSFWPYAGLEHDCHGWVIRFVEWAQSRGVLEFLNRAGSTPELEAA